MGRWISIAMLVCLTPGCATQLGTVEASGADDPDEGRARRALMFQHSSVTPQADDGPLAADALQPGDILLTSMPGLASAGIQLMTLAPVSHTAVYIGDRQVVEAVRSGVQVRRIEQMLDEEAIILVYRFPGLSAEQAGKIRAYALQQVGTRFNFMGVVLHAPFAIERKLCEMPLVPAAVRDACIRSIGAVQFLPTTGRQFFCSQLVLQAYRQAGAPITDADPRLISPADILHMREGDVPSVRIQKPLLQVGYLKYQRPIAVALEQ